ncbi:MAG: choice-of-anchor Q domain-containing protein [Mycobacterium sp.]
MASIAVGLAMVCAFTSVPVALAATFTVTRGDDPTPNGCAPSNCSLREAIIAANGASGSTINLPARTYTLSIPGADGASTNASIGDLDVLSTVAVVGAGSSTTIIQAATSSGNGIHRLFDVHPMGNASISQVTIRYGRDVENESGGCVRNSGVLSLAFVVVTGCTSSAAGAGIASYKTLAITDSVIDANTLTGPANVDVSGGGVANGTPPGGPPGVATIWRAQITNNVSTNVGNPTHNAFGAGFANTGSMNIYDSLISGNVARSSAGGISTGTMTIQNTTVRNNKARFDAGGVDNDGTMTVISSTFANNEAGYQCSGNECLGAYAGGLLNTTDGTMNVVNSTFSGNKCIRSGGAILNSSGTLTVRSSTIVGNTCDLGAGVTGSSTTYLKNTIVANNPSAPTGGDCSGEIISQDYNIIRNTTGCLVSGATAHNSTLDPKVGPLLDNGGSSQTRAPATDSPAVNTADPAGCTDHGNAPLTADQRGFSRPAQGRCDIGAYELGTSVVLWTNDNSAMAWQLNGPVFKGMTGFGGPGPGWTAQSFQREADGSYELLWTADNLAHLWRLTAGNTFLSATGFSGPGAGWVATSAVRYLDGSHELLWTTNNAAQIWRITAAGNWGGAMYLGGPGTGWRATSYYRASDGTRRILWTGDNLAMVWTLTSAGQWLTGQGFSGPGSGWTATSYNLNDDGSFNVVWTSPNVLAEVWTINANGSFRSQVGLGGPSGWTVRSYFFK